VISNLEIHARELRATFLRNHNTGRYKGTSKALQRKASQRHYNVRHHTEPQRHHKGIAKYPKQKITQAHKTPRPPHAESHHNDTTGNGLNTPKPGT